MLSIHVNTSAIKKQFEAVSKEIKAIPRDAHKVFRDKTPKRSGNARNKTKLSRNTIRADYPYAQRLEDGYSKQAPDGMIKHTVKYIEDRLAKFVRKL
jgi:hypothetical protein